MMQNYTVKKCPTTELSYTNKAIINPSDSFAGFDHIAVRYPKKTEAFVFSVTTNRAVGPKEIAFNASGRKWASLMSDTIIEAAPYKFEPETQCLNAITFTVDFGSRPNQQTAAMDFNTDDMAKQFSKQFVNQAFTVGQYVGFAYSTGDRNIVFELKVKDLQAINVDKASTNIGTLSVEIGLTMANTVYMFERAEGSEIRLVGEMTAMVSKPQIFSTNLDMSQLGIGGLSAQFKNIFTQAFAARLLPPEFARAMGGNFVRGILLYGPPGTGKTLIARQIGKMLLAREPKVVNGPEVLNKYVGESEANIRKLFAEAEEEQAKMGIHSGLHVIIFDEIDAICKSRGASASSAGVGDNVVNQLLSKIDGVDALQNVLLIGMTNRRDLIDEALLRPGRLEVQIEIGLPNEEGRLEIFKIHTKGLMETGVLSPDVSLEELASVSKNFTGAEIAGLIGAAKNHAIARVIEPNSTSELTKEMLASIKVTRADFTTAMKENIKPALGASEDRLKLLTKPILQWDPKIQVILERIDQLIQEALETRDQTFYVLFLGEPGAGLTTLASHMARQSQFPFTRLWLAEDTASKPESQAVAYMEKLFYDAKKSELSCVLLDDLDIILRYRPIGPGYSETLVNSIVSSFKLDSEGQHKRLIICTCRREQAIEDMGIGGLFNEIIRVPSLTSPDQVDAAMACMEEAGEASLVARERQELVEALSSIPFRMGIKHLIHFCSIKCDPSGRVRRIIERMHALKLVIKRISNIQF